MGPRDRLLLWALALISWWLLLLPAVAIPVWRPATGRVREPQQAICWWLLPVLLLFRPVLPLLLLVDQRRRPWHKDVARVGPVVVRELLLLLLVLHLARRAPRVAHRRGHPGHLPRQGPTTRQVVLLRRRRRRAAVVRQGAQRLHQVAVALDEGVGDQRSLAAGTQFKARALGKARQRRRWRCIAKRQRHTGPQRWHW